MRLLDGSLLASAVLIAAGCGSGPAAIAAPASGGATTETPAVSTDLAPAASSSPAAVASPAGNPGTGAPSALLRVSILTSSLRLTTPTTRAVAFRSGAGFVVAGGLTPGGTTGRVVRLGLDGRPAVTVGRLAHPVHDAGGAELDGAMLVFGGGAGTQDAWVQRLATSGRGLVAGRLPSARADLSAVTVGREVVIVGGGASGRADPRVLATTDGTHFRVVATLPVAVRYAAVATVGSRVMVMGGTSATGDTALIQSVDIARGTAAVVGRLPQAISHATALVVRGVVLVAGGRHAGRAIDGVVAVDPASFAARVVGRLPHPASDSAGVVVDGVGYLVGGETNRPLVTIITIAPA